MLRSLLKQLEKKKFSLDINRINAKYYQELHVQ